MSSPQIDSTLPVTFFPQQHQGKKHVPPRDSIQNNLISNTVRYYEMIDRGDVDGVIGLFMEDATYKRGESFFADLQEIEHFFRTQRKITGVHHLKTILYQKGLIVVRGDFLGKGADGLPRHVEFCDFWDWDASGKVKGRQTFLALGSHYVR